LGSQFRGCELAPHSGRAGLDATGFLHVRAFDLAAAVR